MTTETEALSIRRNMLNDTDWIVVKSLEAGVAVPSNWVTYRQALRDVPAQADYPDTITWPTKPE
ncbi:phage tail assembly chaperone [Amylibacter sp.]|nr:phage tail assembly chaperone [Amylibacter sp.]